MFGVLFPATFLVRVAALLTCCDEPWRSLDTDESGLALQGECQCGLAEGARTLLAANAIFCFFRFLANYKVHPRLGVLIHVITVVQGDVGRWFAILLFVVLGFAFAFSGLSPPRRLKLHSDEASPFLIPIWNFFDLQNVSAVTEDSEAPALGMTLLALYLFLSQVLLVNILIVSSVAQHALCAHCMHGYPLSSGGAPAVPARTDLMHAALHSSLGACVWQPPSLRARRR